MKNRWLKYKFMKMVHKYYVLCLKTFPCNIGHTSLLTRLRKLRSQYNEIW
jgi:hypothetical protein